MPVSHHELIIVAFVESESVYTNNKINNRVGILVATTTPYHGNAIK